MTRMRTQCFLERHVEEISAADDRVKGASHDCTKQNAIKAEHRKNGKPLDSHLCMDGIVGAYSPLTTDKVGCDKMKWTPASLKRPSISKSLILLIGQAQSYAYGTVVGQFHRGIDQVSGERGRQETDCISASQPDNLYDGRTAISS